MTICAATEQKDGLNAEEGRISGVVTVIETEK